MTILNGSNVHPLSKRGVCKAIVNGLGPGDERLKLAETGLLILCDRPSVRANQGVALKDVVRRFFEIHVVGHR
jgi:hypothetical protein